MQADLFVTPDAVRRADGATLHPMTLRWEACDALLGEARRVPPAEAAQWLLTSGRGRRLPVAIIGPRDPTPRSLADAEDVAHALAKIGFPLICGGRGGAMEAASRGCASAGGLMIGILPSDDWREANDHVAVPIATGIGEARNAVIATAAFALVSVGGREAPVSYGTISEMAFGLRHGRLVIGMPEAPDLPGVVRCATAGDAVARVARRYLALD
ncbi:SLOG cluster 4 domain-containing protein [Roseomonas rosulenta]|uniref:SLOG cluster 4 domain-containing protein n=1 Tax=Roseomonas rosulenta TaxID=2748667 RepID=UPI0018DF3281|nr:DNA-binding protein [Roseomonas rosulenta]